MTEKEIMLGVPDEDDGREYVDLDEHRAVLGLPSNAVEVEINAKVFHDGALIDVTKIMTLDDLRTAFRKADDGYIDEDDRFVITQKGLDWIEEHGR